VNRPGTPPAPVDLSGEWRVHASDGDLARRFTDPGISDADWPEVPVPGHWRSTEPFGDSDGPMLYRRTFAGSPLEPGDRRFLTFDGIFYDGDIWLDGGYVGATAGYFFPHTFEITQQALEVPDGGHLLAVEVASPPQRDRTKKRTITGVFSHWDNLDPDWNPGGIWRPVRLRDTGPVRIKWLRALCSEASETRGRLLLDVTLDSGEDPEPVPLGARLHATVSGPDGRLLAESTQDVMLAAGDNTLTMTVDVDHPPRWWPWRLGAQPQCDVEVRVEVAGVPSDDRRLRTAFRELRWKHWELTVNGERMFPMGSNHGPTRMALAEATTQELIRDVQLAVEANLDLLRIHAHVTRLELYDAADAAGLLLWQDLPLQWGYARGTRKEAVRQAREMVDLLGHHPSIALWCAHNEPLAIDLQPGDAIRARDVVRTGVSMFLPSWNKDVLDRSVARAIHKADPTRAVNPHSGVLPGLTSSGTDTHFYFGWYHGRMDGLAGALRAVPRLARFVTEFGAQAVPDSAAFMHPERWPDLDWDELFEHHALQKRYFDEHVPPALFDSFGAWRDATQHYQAALIQLQVEDLRRIAHAPAGGFCQFCFADGQPGVTWSVLDHERRPKLGHAALRAACRSVLPMLEPRRGLLHVASELRHPLTGVEVEAHLDGRVRRFTGDIAPGAVGYVGGVHLDRRTTSVVLVLRHPAVGEVRNEYDNLLEWLRIVRD
jgi:beta-mannosidase